MTLMWKVLLLMLLLMPAGIANSSEAAKTPVTRYTLSPEKYQKAIRYARARYILYFAGTAYGMAVLLAMIVLRWSVKFRAVAERLSSRRIVQALIFTPLVLLTLAILDLPVEAIGHTLSLQYGQSVQGWPSWFWDWMKGQLVAIVIGVPLIWVLYAVIRKSPARWWFYFWLASLPMIVFIIFIAPVVIEPLFFTVKPLDASHPELVTEIERVVQRGGLTIPRERMFEMVASEKLNSTNAYVTGFGASKRIVVWDTTIQKMTVPQTLCVFGHEMGHYVLGHIPKSIAFAAVVLLVCLYSGFVLLRKILARWNLGIRNAGDWASLPVLYLLFVMFAFAGSPVVCAYSRFQEHQADVYGLEVVHGLIPDSQEVAAETFQVLGEINLSDPDPGTFIKIWLYDHPTIGERVVFARQYDPWSKGQSPEFVK